MLIEQIEIKYLNRVILHVGLGVAFYDFLELGDPYLYPGEGASVQQAKFRLVVFHPFVGEVLTGNVVGSNKDGLKISVDFFDDIHVPGSLLQEPSEFIPSIGLWKWLYEGSDDFVLRIGEQVGYFVQFLHVFKGTC
ncbi:hypothetical protein EON65_11200 [archaeon]|nr:MAG: hypothetical protein EON65_11200 [archaeon]